MKIRESTEQKVSHTMATAKELYSFLDSIFPKSLSCAWDNDGAMCMSDPEREVKRVLVALDITMGAVDYAIDNGFDVIVSHHPLIFTPMRSINGCDVKSRVITKLMRNGISAFSFHTRLDAANGGVNDMLCEVLGIQNAEPFVLGGESLARVGTIEPISGKELALLVKEKLSCDGVSYTCPDKMVSKVVLVGGAGKDFIDAALDSFADALITGEVSYNAAIDAADSGLCLICAGHFFTENPVLASLEKQIIAFDPEIKVESYNSNLLKQI